MPISWVCGAHHFPCFVGSRVLSGCRQYAGLVPHGAPEEDDKTMYSVGRLSFIPIPRSSAQACTPCWHVHLEQFGTWQQASKQSRDTDRRICSVAPGNTIAILIFGNRCLLGRRGLGLAKSPASSKEPLSPGPPPLREHGWVSLGGVGKDATASPTSGHLSVCRRRRCTVWPAPSVRRHSSSLRARSSPHRNRMPCPPPHVFPAAPRGKSKASREVP